MKEHILANLSTRELENFFFDKQDLYFELSERARKLLERTANRDRGGYQSYRAWKAKWLYIKLIGKFDAYSYLYKLKK